MLKNKYLRALSINAATADNEGQWITNRNQSSFVWDILQKRGQKKHSECSLWTGNTVPPLQSEGGEFLFVLKFNILSAARLKAYTHVPAWAVQTLSIFVRL